MVYIKVNRKKIFKDDLQKKETYFWIKKKLTTFKKKKGVGAPLTGTAALVGVKFFSFGKSKQLVGQMNENPNKLELWQFFVVLIIKCLFFSKKKIRKILIMLKKPTLKINEKKKSLVHWLDS